MQACLFRLDNWIKFAGYRVDRKNDLAYEAPANDEQPEEAQTKPRVLSIAYRISGYELAFTCYSECYPAMYPM